MDAEGDAFPCLDRYFSDPLGLGTKTGTDMSHHHHGMPAFITFPGVKDKEWAQRHPGKVSCQMLMMADHRWFRDCDNATAATASASAVENKQALQANGTPARSAAYLALKEEWKSRALEILYMYYPKVM